MTDIAATVWSPKSAQGEFTSGSSNDIVDASGDFLVDASSNDLIDSGNMLNGIPVTTWITSDGS